MNEAQNIGRHKWLFVSLFVFLSVNVLKVQAQCPSVFASASSATICSGTTATILLKSDQPGTTYSWTVSQTDVVGAADGTGSGITCNLTSTEAVSGSAVFTIIPIAKGCKGTPAVITIKVNPGPEITAVPQISTIISGSASAIALRSNIDDTEFFWTVIRSGVSGASDGSGPVINQKISATAEKGMATFHITPSFKGCAGNSINVKVIVKKTL